jgi:hypothetical protein
MRKNLLLFCILVNIGLNAQTVNEVEPNNTFATANTFLSGSTMIGNVGGTGDANDYFIGFPADGGTLKIFFQYNNTSTSNHSGLLLYAYNKNQTSIGTKFNYSIPPGNHSDS